MNPKIGDIVFTHLNGDLIELKIKDENSMQILSVEHIDNKTCKHQSGDFAELFMNNVIFHRCNDCFKILFHTIPRGRLLNW